MSAVAAETPELYSRFKSLAVTASAALILGAQVDELGPKTDQLYRDAVGTPCEEPAASLRQLVRRALSGEVSDADVDAVRSLHRSLRREVWTTQPCEYVPCCAGTHDQR